MSLGSIFSTGGSTSRSTLVRVSPAPGPEVDFTSQDDQMNASRKERGGSAIFYQKGEVSVEMNDLNQMPPNSERATATSPTTVVTPPQQEAENLSEQVRNVLKSRPTIRRMNQAYKSRSRILSGKSLRRDLKYRSLPANNRSVSANVLRNSNTIDGGLRRTSSFPEGALPSEAGLVEEDGAEEPGDSDYSETDEGFLEPAFHRQSTRRLKERIDLRRETRVDAAIARESLWDNLKHVKWPKFKSRVKVLLSWELWKGHMKEVEGHFGTAVVSYFIFLRFLFVMNLIIFALWFGLVVIPGIIYVQVNDPPTTPSQATCVYQASLYPSQICPSDNATILTANSTFQDDVLFQMELASVYSCTFPQMGNQSFVVRECAFGSVVTASAGGIEYRVAEREGETTITVANVRPDEVMDCMFQDNSTNFQVIELRICSGNIAPRILWYQYIVDFVLGQGIFNETILFYGRYGNTTVVGESYSLPLAYLLVTGTIYTISVIFLVYKLGRAYNESHTQFTTKRRINFSNKVFTAWDFNITHPNTARLKKVHIRTDFEEELADYEKRNLQRTKRELAKVIVIRIFTNLFTFLVLAGGAAAIFFAAQYGLQNRRSGISFEGLVLPVVITALNLIFPFLFSFLAHFEHFKTQSGEIKMTLVRAIMVRLSSLVVLVVTIFILISCTQEMVNNTQSGACTFISTTASLTGVIANATREIVADCPVCWETFVGQELYKLGLTNFVVSAISTIAVETLRNIVSRIKYKGLGEKIGKGNFNIPKSILDLIYTQALLWLGFFFSPMLPAVIMLTSFVLFYVKKYSLICNLAPDKRGAFRAARTNFLFILLMLLCLFLILVPIGYLVANFVPSATCGPFRGKQGVFTVIVEVINNFSCSAQQFFDFIGSVGFIIPVIVLLLLLIFAQYVVLRARKERFRLIKKQLVLEGANVTHIVGKLDGVLRRLAEQRASGPKDMTDAAHKTLEERLLNIRTSISEQQHNSDLITTSGVSL